MGKHWGAMIDVRCHSSGATSMAYVWVIALPTIRVPSRNDWGYFKIEMISTTSIDPSRFADVEIEDRLPKTDDWAVHFMAKLQIGRTYMLYKKSQFQTRQTRLKLGRPQSQIRQTTIPN